MCRPSHHHHHNACSWESGAHPHGCCWSGPGAKVSFFRRYPTIAEERAELEAYLKELKQEVQAVEERLASLGSR